MKHQYDPKKDYCGPGQGFLTRIIPRKIGGVDINKVCYKHDCAWAQKDVRHKEADLAFKEHIEDEFISEGKKILGYFVSNIYYFAVRLGRAYLWIKEKL